MPCLLKTSKNAGLQQFVLSFYQNRTAIHLLNTNYILSNRLKFVNYKLEFFKILKFKSIKFLKFTTFEVLCMRPIPPCTHLQHTGNRIRINHLKLTE